MADGMSSIIIELRRMRQSLEEAILALEPIDRVEPIPDDPIAVSETKDVVTKRTAAATAVVAKTAPRKGGMSPEGKSRLIAALKARWAAKKAAAGALPVKKASRSKKAA